MADYNSELYVPAPNLQQVFFDKLDGSLLAGGKVYFYEDTGSRSTFKSVFYLTGTAPNYEVTAFPNPLILSSIGSIVDPSGDAKIPYLNPYDSSGTALNYYIEFYSADDTFQFSLENVPGIGVGGGDNNEAGENYIGNGQFRLHNDIKANGSNAIGKITEDDTAIAPGGHYFVRETVTSGDEFVTFERETNIPASGNPRYYGKFQVTGSTPNGARKDYVFRFKNVDTFPADTSFTFSFVAKVSTGSVQVTPFFYKYFGATGSAPEYEAQPAQTVNTGEQKYNITITDFGDNSGKSYDENDEDYIEIGIRFPLNSPFECFITDIMLYKGSDANSSYPTTTSQEDAYRALAGGFPYVTASGAKDIYDGSLIGLPVFVGQTGLQADITKIGEVVALTSEHSDLSDTPYAFANGQKFETGATSSFGVPYSRLQSKYWDSTLKLPLYGTGLDFFTTLHPAADGNLIIFNNQFGAATAVNQSSGGPFTLPAAADITHKAQTDDFFIRAYESSTADSFYLETREAIPITLAVLPLNPTNGAPSAAFTFNIIYSFTDASTTGFTRNTDSSRGYFEIVADSAANLSNAALVAKHWTFESYDAANDLVKKFYVWYKVAGTETDPATVGYTGIEIVLDAADTAQQVAAKTLYALVGGEVTVVGCPTAATVTGTPYLTLQGAGSIDYYIWLNKNGTGVDPTLSGTGIEVAVVDGDTAINIADSILEAANGRFYAVPDLRGIFLRGWDDGRILDPDTATRYTYVPGISGDKVGTNEVDLLGQHSHKFSSGNGGAAAGSQTGPDNSNQFTQAGGSTETRPYNISVQYVIRL